MEALTKQLADALSTAIAMGFVNENNKMSGNYKTEFIYEKPTDKANHDRIVELFNQYGIGVEIKEQIPALPQLIFAKDSKYINPKSFAEGVASATNKLEVTITRIKSKEGISLNGAYIGGLFKPDNNTLQLCSPSLLKKYAPRYRKIDVFQQSIRNSFEKASNITKFLQTVIPATQAHHSGTISAAPVHETSSDDIISDGQLFGSQHGMIVAMCTYYNTKQNNYFVELALGEDTNKVASCIPCSIFMSANSYAASFTHFGRGDNWNLPASPELLIGNWANKICGCIKSFLEIYRSAKKRNNNIDSMLTYLFGSDYENIEKYINSDTSANIDTIIDKCKKDICNIFLESLTYESSFIDKINSTLSLV